jgi:branched-chain amino acid transport system permease protein
MSGYNLLIKGSSMPGARSQKFNDFLKKLGGLVRPVIGILVIAWAVWRMYLVISSAKFGPETWLRLIIAGLVVGGMYALIAIGYTLVYGILGMINFAHGEVVMVGAFAGYFVLQGLKSLSTPNASNPALNFLNAYPWISVFLAFAVGMIVSAATGYFLEKIAYRPLRNAPRLVPLISAIGASIFLQNAVQLLFSPQVRDYPNPEILLRGSGFTFNINGSNVILTYTGILAFLLSLLLMGALYYVVQRTRLGRSMRAIAQDKKTAALMGVNVDDVISKTFIISGLLAGAAGVMWGFQMGLINYFMGFLPGIKAFTAAVLGGIGNIPGAMVGGLVLGVVESIGPALLGVDFQLKDVIAFLILILIFLFRPTGLLGTTIKEEKL